MFFALLDIFSIGFEGVDKVVRLLKAELLKTE
jgi:hypothetical protein